MQIYADRDFGFRFSRHIHIWLQYYYFFFFNFLKKNGRMCKKRVVARNSKRSGSEGKNLYININISSFSELILLEMAIFTIRFRLQVRTCHIFRDHENRRPTRFSNFSAIPLMLSDQPTDPSSGLELFNPDSGFNPPIRIPGSIHRSKFWIQSVLSGFRISDSVNKSGFWIQSTDPDFGFNLSIRISDSIRFIRISDIIHWPGIRI